MADACLAFEMRRSSAEVCSDTAFYLLAIGFIDAAEPLFRAVSDLVFSISQHRLPARREVDCVMDQVPIPKTVVCSARSQGVALLAFAKGLFSALVRQLSNDSRQGHRKIDRLRDVVVGADFQSL